jgi:hypothetical protein
MKPAIKKAPSGKTMRVATLFTGTAACAFAFAPAAVAASTGQHAVARPDSGTTGNIKIEDCTPSRAHWVHFTDRGGSICFGDRGTWSGNRRDAYVSANKICPGNNWGFYGGYSASDGGAWYTGEFAPNGGRWPHLPNPGFTRLTLMHISGFSGSNQCTI